MREDQRKVKSEESSKSGKVVPTSLDQRVGSGVKDSGREEVFGDVRGCPAGGTEVIWGPAHSHQETDEG